MSSLKKRILTAVIMLASLIIVPVTVIFPCITRSIEVPQRQWITGIDSSEVHFSSTLPPGNYFDFFLSVPKDQTLAAAVSGSVSIKEAGNIVIECPIGSGAIEKAGDIGPEGSQNYELRWPENTGAGPKGILQGRHTYEFVIRFSPKPPAGSSLWISWLQRGRD